MENPSESCRLGRECPQDRLVRERLESYADVTWRARSALQVQDKKHLGSNPGSDGWIQNPINLDSSLIYSVSSEPHKPPPSLPRSEMLYCLQPGTGLGACQYINIHNTCLSPLTLEPKRMGSVPKLHRPTVLYGDKAQLENLILNTERYSSAGTAQQLGSHV